MTVPVPHCGPIAKQAIEAEHAETSAKLRPLLERRRAAGLVEGIARPAEDAAVPPAGWKRVSFIRHGQGYHNVAQLEWLEAQKAGLPYTADMDPEYKFLDPDLTELGREQAEALKPRAAAMGDVELVVVSTMRRATRTALVGFESLVAAGVPVVANELCHEQAGKHTCDKRRSLTELRKEFPQVDYSQIEAEEDPYWDTQARETHEMLVERGGKFVAWLLQRPESRIAVAAHSGWLVHLFHAGMECHSTDAVNLLAKFATGEMRTVLLAPRAVAEAAAGKRPAVDESAAAAPARKRPAAALA